MKKVVSLVIITMILSVFGGLPVSAEKEYITNGGFDTGGFTGWSRSGHTADGNSITVEEESGNYYAKLVSEKGGLYFARSNDISFQPGDIVTLSFDLRIMSLVEGAKPRVAIAFKTAEGKTIEMKPYYDFYENRGEWATYTLDLKIPDTSYGINFLFRLMDGGGEIHFDNISLTDSKNETSLKVAYGDLQLDRIPDNVNSLKAKLHYVSESGVSESGNLIFAAYSGEALSAMEIVPFSTDNSIYKEVTLNLPDGAEDISVKAYVWKNGQTLQPVAERELLPKTGRSAVFDRFVTDRMRAAYGASTQFYKDEDGDGSYEVIDKLLDAGINTFIFQIHTDRNGVYADKDFNALHNVLKDLSDFAEKTDSMIFAKFNFGTNAVVQMKNYDMYHPGYTHTRTSVCPLAEGYWKDAMQARMEIAAQYPKITGVIFDMEMYSGNGTRYNTPCLCDTCVGRFAAAHPSDAAAGLTAAAAETRWEYAKVNNIYADYKNWQAGEITKITSSIREHLHKINPNLILGMMPGYDWLDGLEAGLGTEEMPVVIFAEGSYNGNIVRNRMDIAMMENDGVHAVVATGLYPREDGAHITVENFPSKMLEGGMLGIGYWIYEILYLEHDFALADGESYADYYPAIKEGHQQLDEALGLN